MNLLLFIENLQIYSHDLLWLMGVVFVINTVNWLLMGSILNIFGVTPRKIWGLIGVIFAPILHGGPTHFILNAFPFFCLSLLMIASLGFYEYALTIVGISLLSGLLIWIFARPGVHIGASAMITGIFSWLVYQAYLHPDPMNLIILMIVLFYFGSMIAGVLPSDQMISWEGHLMGLIAGMAIAAHQPIFMEHAMRMDLWMLEFLQIHHWSELFMSPSGTIWQI